MESNYLLCLQIELCNRVLSFQTESKRAAAGGATFHWSVLGSTEGILSVSDRVYGALALL